MPPADRLSASVRRLGRRLGVGDVDLAGWLAVTLRRTMIGVRLVRAAVQRAIRVRRPGRGQQGTCPGFRITKSRMGSSLSLGAAAMRAGAVPADATLAAGTTR
jgi:hypothetical protein